MKLLDKTIRSYLFYSFIIVLVAIPAFYIVVQKVLLHSVDRSLRAQMRDIRANLAAIHSAGELQVWSKMDKDIALYPADSVLADKIYTANRLNPWRHDKDPYREIRGTISVQGSIYQLVISNSLVENEDLLGSIVLVMSFLLVLLMAGLLWINRRISQVIWRPFYDALNTMKQYKLTRHASLQPAATHIREFDELNKTVTELLDRNYQLYLAQKEFTENAAHEMQTPLAILQGKIDLLMQTEPLNEDQANLISSLEETNLRLSKLNKSLLFLSKIENNQFPQTERITICPFVQRIADQYQAAADLKGISIKIQCIEEMVVEANPTLLEVLLNNLFSNALRYNRPGGAILAAISDRALVVENTGIDEALPADKIFARFYKSGEDYGSVGLGLAIAKKICDGYHYSIDYQFLRGHHLFRVQFPSP